MLLSPERFNTRDKALWLQAAVVIFALIASLVYAPLSATALSNDLNHNTRESDNKDKKAKKEKDKDQGDNDDDDDDDDQDKEKQEESKAAVSSQDEKGAQESRRKSQERS